MRGMRLAIALVTAATLVVLFVVARPKDDDDETAGTTTAITRTAPPEAQPAAPTTTEPTDAEADFGLVSVRIVGGEPGEIVRTTVHKGDPVRVVVRGDIRDEVHIHGYDLKADVAPGRPADIRFEADLTGRFEIELEDAAKQIAQLTVLP